MSEFTKKQIQNYYNWRHHHGKILPEDSPQNSQEAALHHIGCIDRITELEAALAEKTDWCIEIDELAVTLQTQLEAVKEIIKEMAEDIRLRKADNGRGELTTSYYFKRFKAAIGENDG
jgi:hypothetical protein